MSNVKRCNHVETAVTAKQAEAIAKVLKVDADQLVNVTLVPELESK